MILVDGIATAAVHANDRGLAYGDGVFRTFLARDGRPRHWKRHYAKLASDCAVLAIRCPEPALLWEEVARACDGAVREHAVKITVTRGRGRRGYAYADDPQPTRIVSAAPHTPYPPEYATEGVRVRRCRLTLSQQPALAGVKHLNRLENVIARAEWDDVAIAEGLLCDAAGNVIGGTMTNLFVAKDDVLVTPDLTRCGVAGVTRERVIDAARLRGLDCRTADLAWDDLTGADEAFVVNSLAGAWAVREIDGVPKRVGPLARAAQDWLSGTDEESA